MFNSLHLETSCILTTVCVCVIRINTKTLSWRMIHSYEICGTRNSIIIPATDYSIWNTRIMGLVNFVLISYCLRELHGKGTLVKLLYFFIARIDISNHVQTVLYYQCQLHREYVSAIVERIAEWIWNDPTEICSSPRPTEQGSCWWEAWAGGGVCPQN